jgi:hypothetical protein
VLLLLGATLFCAYRAAIPPEPIATELARASNWDLPGAKALDLDDVGVIQRNYRQTAIRGLVLGLVGLALWGWLWRVPNATAMVPVLGALMLAELLWFGRGLNPQMDPALYFPRLPVLVEIGKAPPGRMLCVACLPARLAETHGLWDIRGYDGFDPLRLVEVLEIARDDQRQVTDYAPLQWYVPEIIQKSDGRMTISPVLDMLNVRYLVFRTPRPPVVKALFEHDDYWAVENSRALPRVHVPERVEFKASDDEVLEALAAPGFDPVSVAYVRSPLDLPNPMSGEATIDAEVPTRVTVTARMKTSGLVVLADLWFDGWTVELNGEPVPIVRTNHALRGVVVPAGTSTLVFSYAPAGFTAGIRLMAVALVVLAGWGLIGVRRARRDRLGR